MPGGTSITTSYAYYGYDASGNPTPDYRQGQLQSVTTNGRTVSYDYDILGNKIAMQTPSGKTVGYGYDVLSRLQTVTHYDGATTTFTYDKVGNRQNVTRTNAAGTVFSTTGYVYDSLNRLTDIINKNGSNGLVSSYHYGLRLDGKRSSVTESGPYTSNATSNYTYDDQGKLTQEAGPYGTIAYGYDNVGNRLTRTVTGSTTALLPNGATINTYDLNDRIATVNGSITHTYDLDGNETTVNGQAASYDFENHLISLANPANGTILASYVYDADGNRVSTYVSANTPTTTSYVVDTSLPYASVVEEYTGGSTTPSARYDYGDDLVRMDRGSGVYYYIYDGLGSTRQLVNTGGAVTDSYGYSAFGELASRTPSTGGTVNPFLFNAQQFDQASGTYYLRARYYDQSNGRFISQDPLSGSNDDPVSLHRYLYANADPIDNYDPTGKETLCEILVANIIGISVGAVVGAVTYGVRYHNIKYAATGAIVGAQFGFAIQYARTSGNEIQAITTALFVGLASWAIEGLGDFAEGKMDDFYRDRKYERVLLEGAANGAVTGALEDMAHPGILAFGLTIIQDVASDLPAHELNINKDISDALTQAIVAEATSGIVPRTIDADGMARVGKLMPEFLSGEASSYVTLLLGGLWATPAGITVKELFDALKEAK